MGDLEVIARFPVDNPPTVSVFFVIFCGVLDFWAAGWIVEDIFPDVLLIFADTVIPADAIIQQLFALSLGNEYLAELQLDPVWYV